MTSEILKESAKVVATRPRRTVVILCSSCGENVLSWTPRNSRECPKVGQFDNSEAMYRKISPGNWHNSVNKQGWDPWTDCFQLPYIFFYQITHEEQGESTAEGQKSHIHPLWRTVHEEIVLKYSMLYLLTEECTGARSSNLVEGLITRPTMYDHRSRSKGWRSRA